MRETLWPARRRGPSVRAVTTTPDQTPSPEGMRAAMADYVRTVHQAYLSQAAGQPPGVRGRLALLDEPFTVVAAGVRNLHVIATTESLPAPVGQEVAMDDELGALRWTLRFYDPAVLPALGMLDETAGPASDGVRRVLGIATHIYHLVVQPGGSLTTHHAGHAGAGLAMDHIADARDFEAIRAHARGREALVDEMVGAARAGLRRAQVLLAREIVGDDLPVDGDDPRELRRAVLEAVRPSLAGGRHG